MSNTVLQLTPTQIEHLQSRYSSYITQVPPHTHFQMKIDGITITAYLSGKVVFQGNHIEAFLEQAGLAEEPSAKKTNSATTASTLPKGFAQWSVIGSDEVGTGSYFGPLTVASAYVSSEHIPTLQKMGVQDSKNLTDAQIRSIVPKIKALIPYKLLVLKPEKYNEVQETKNLNEMKAMLHNQALNLLQQKIAPEKPQAILIDEFCNPNTYYRYLQGQPIVGKDITYFAQKGESHHIAVAAASMIARDAFLNGLEELSQQSGYKIPSGANAAVDQLAATILRQEGEDGLRKLAKLHFANTKKAHALLRR